MRNARYNYFCQLTFQAKSNVLHRMAQTRVKNNKNWLRGEAFSTGPEKCKVQIFKKMIFLNFYVFEKCKLCELRAYVNLFNHFCELNRLWRISWRKPRSKIIKIDRGAKHFRQVPKSVNCKFFKKINFFCLKIPNHHLDNFCKV